MKSLIIILLAGGFLYLGAVIYLYVTQDSRIFNKKWAKPYEPRTAKKIYFKTDDGINLEGAYTKNGENLPLALYFGGNANNVIEFLDKTAPKINNYNFIGFNYPGYAGSGGKPCEKCILKYALEIYDKYKPQIVIGRSLGTAVASYVAYKRPVKKLVLITPFDSIAEIAKNKYPFLPVEKIVKYKFNEYLWVEKLDIPVSVLLVENDDVIPEPDIQNLLKHIKNLKRKIIISGVKHGNVYEYGNIAEILKQLLAQ
jgi:hypothetical protein